MSNKTVTQFNMFGEPDVHKIKKSRKKVVMSDYEREEQKAKQQAKKDKEWEKKWAERGVFQGQLFPTDECISNAVAEVIKESVQRIEEENKSGINIKPENRGKFTKTKQETGKTTSELLHSKNPKTRQRANFARMAKRGFKPLKK